MNHTRRRRRKPGDRALRFWYGEKPPPLPPYRGLIEDPDPNNPVTGICCSGGGIRSAAYNLGALQVLQRCGVFQDAKYLAAVSGGSYIAGGLAMVAKTSKNPAEMPDDSDAADDSDERLVTEQYPPFYRGSPEEQYLRHRSSYMAPIGGSGRARLIARIGFGLLVNLTLIGSVVVLASVALAIWSRWAHDGLVGDNAHVHT